MKHSDNPQPSRIRSQVLETLMTEFAVFREYRPLAIGIHKAIRERLPTIDPHKLRLTLKAHTGSTRYLKAVSQGKQRFDLDGNPAGEITVEQSTLATETLRERFKKASERKRAEEQAKERQEKLAQLVGKFGKH